ncbi:LOW QUALITY PROTEIN: uncharacterized protein LOC112569941 [Pomacea canaliculata]|uniref:LOW QUALITY PROTEIN: uncharacterized protein LOC112569941 n=1 Tax=Pomacea canaliculata TaxID=400727 RepID=UPI000D737011|nr:LOW QUALITY PROTEIN: uncharacterized protein LOC112569941 [Pomacea canaliculata]
MDSELKKTSVRANLLEKKRFEMLMAGFESAKRCVAVDMKKSQLDVKRRLKRYKERQREILATRSGNSPSDMEDFVLKQLRKRSPLQQGTRPQTSPSLPTRPHLALSDDCLARKPNAVPRQWRISTKRATMIMMEEEVVVAGLSHCRRSKVDLRPSTAWSAMLGTRSTRSATNGAGAAEARLLQLRTGHLGSPARQVRYLDDEEIEERCAIYRFLLRSYRQKEHEHVEALNMRVRQFCGWQGKGQAR